MSTAIHIWHQCYHCSTAPLEGTRYHCEDCPDGPDNDLCQTCFAQYEAGHAPHPAPSAYAKPVKEKHHFSTHEGLSSDRYATWPDIPLVDATAPLVPDKCLVRPEFCSGYESAFGGYSFAAQTDQGVLVFTALHVMHELALKKGIDTSVDNNACTGNELPEAITGVNLYDVLQERWMFHELGKAGPMLVLPEARTHAEEPHSDRDIAAFAADHLDLNPLPLAASPPQPGEPVWLGLRMDDTRRTRGMVVVETRDDGLIFRYAEPDEGPRYSSGAPVINAHGEVVAINVGAGYYQGLRFGHANHVGNIRKHLASARLPK